MLTREQIRLSVRLIMQTGDPSGILGTPFVPENVPKTKRPSSLKQKDNKIKKERTTKNTP